LDKLIPLSLKNGLVDDGVKGFVLEPYDEVIVHSSPSYNVQKHVSASGEVNFAGTYSLSVREERLSDLVKKSGGVTQFAYMKGARLFRQRSEAEQRQLDDEIERMLAQGDTTSVRLLNQEREYPVAINLQDAIEHPGGNNDIVLREGDRLEIPVYNNTIRVSGAVMMPNAVAYNPKYTAHQYIKMCGGFATRAKRNHSYIVKMNGAAVPYSPSMRLEPGSEIVVPQKPERNVTATQVAAALGQTLSATASIVTALAILIRYSK